jgi:hypothetical protein
MEVKGSSFSASALRLCPSRVGLDKSTSRGSGLPFEHRPCRPRLLRNASPSQADLKTVSVSSPWKELKVHTDRLAGVGSIDRLSLWWQILLCLPPTLSMVTRRARRSLRSRRRASLSPRSKLQKNPQPGYAWKRKWHPGHTTTCCTCTISITAAAVASSGTILSLSLCPEPGPGSKGALIQRPH